MEGAKLQQKYQYGTTKDNIDLLMELLQKTKLAQSGNADKQQVSTLLQAAQGAQYSWFIRTYMSDLLFGPDGMLNDERPQEEARIDRKLQRQLRRALQSLQQNGYCNESSMEELSDKMMHLIPAAHATFGLLPPKWQCLRWGEGYADKIFNAYKEELWLHAIEILVLTYEPNKLCTEEIWPLYPVCIDHIRELYTIFSLQSMLSIYVTDKEIGEDARRLQKKAKTVSKAAKKELRKINEANALMATTRLKSASYDEAMQKMARQQKELENQLYELRKENQLLALMLEAAKSESEDDLPVENAEISADSSPETLVNCVESLQDDDEKYKDVVLPEDQTVIFLGGHPNWVKKMRRVHPNWRYISSSEDSIAPVMRDITTKITCIILYSKSISHSVFKTVAQQDKNIPVLYLNCLNLELAEKIIRKEYAIKVLGRT